jgi:alpha-L-arabinofuranosidase
MRTQRLIANLSAKCQVYNIVKPNFLHARALLLLCLFALLAPRAWPADLASISIRADQQGAQASSNLFGIFFEEINYGGDGGLYGELVRNRSFSSSANPDFWTLITQGTATGQMSVDTSRPLNTNNLRSLMLTMASGSGSVGAANSGYWGIALQSGATYDLSLYARGSNGFSGPVTVRLESADGSQLYAQSSFGGLTTNWQRFTASLVSGSGATNARIAVAIAQPGAVWLDEVSLFPRATFNGRTNGLRLDLANMLADMKPSIYRYPGGNFIESNTLTNAVRWKKTIGEVASRPGHLNDSWGYWSTDGYGLDEFFRQCEDMGMNPIYGINAGLMLGYNGSSNNTVPLSDMGPWVQDALDLIQYANGDTNTPWGALRAANGHPAPYGLTYLEIGNENGGTYYDQRYTLFYDAIKAQYPEIRLISPVWGSPSSPTSRPVEIRDEHYYSSPATFISYATKYDSYSRTGPHAFVGEYAVTSGYGTYGNLSAALGEATFMTGMERNADIVEIASYAPLFANVNGIQWRPDLIYYNSASCFGTPSYYVQQMFSRNRGQVILPITVTAPVTITNPPPRGAIGLGSWSTSVQYSNVVVTSNGVVLYQSDFVNAGANGWRVYNGSWDAASGLYEQTSASTTDCRSTTGNTNWANYTLSLRARKVSGSEGFLILFNWLDDNNWNWLNIGGWNNTLDGIEQNVNGSKTILGTRNSDSIATNQWYDISVVLNNLRIQCYLNGTLIQDVTNPATSPGGLYASSLYDQASRQVVVKAVNPYSQPLTTTFNVAGVDAVSSNATLIQLTSGSSADENSLAAPRKVFPTTNLLSHAGTNLSLTLPANSLSVLRLQLATPLPPTGLRAAATGWQVGLQWAPYSSATNFILKRATTPGGPYAPLATTSGTSYTDTDVVSGHTYYYVLSAVLPSGPTPDTAEVAAAVGATLRAWLPFDVSSGTTAVDATGNGWDGTLVNNAGWADGYSGNALNLNGTNQYVSLPTGVVAGLGDFSITAWVNLATAGLWSRIFDFGFNTTTYMVLTPNNGSTIRFVISTNGNSSSSEQRINGPATLPTGGWHHVAVTESGGVGILYVDGVGVGTNSAMTLTPGSMGATTRNWLGRSQFSGDAYLNGKVDDFRIYAGALSASDVATFLTPLVAPTGVSATPGDGQATVSWSASQNANGYLVKRATTSGGPYSLIATNWVRLTFTDTTALNGTTYFYVVAATNTVGASSNSIEVSARPVAPNYPPVVSPVTNQFVIPGQQLIVTNVAYDQNAVAFSLGSSAPAGATISTNGIFQWTPTCGQGSTTNLITVLATDNGAPPMTGSNSFLVTVAECLEAGLGNTVMLAGQTSSVPIRLLSTTALTNMAFTVLFPPDRFTTNFALVVNAPQVLTQQWRLLGSGQVELSFALQTNTVLHGPTNVGELRFVALPNQSSAFVPLPLADVNGYMPNGSLAGNTHGDPGRVVVIGAEPLLQANASDNGTALLTLYGEPGASYTIASTTNISDATWQPGWSLSLTGLWQTYQIPATNPARLFRASKP